MTESETKPREKRVAIITGASSGLGREFARQIDLLQQVDELWLVARNHDALQEVADQLSSPAVPVVANLGSKADIAAIRQRLADFNPDVRYLVNAAGFGKFGDWQTISDAAVDRPQLPRTRRHDACGAAIHGARSAYRAGRVCRGVRPASSYERICSH